MLPFRILALLLSLAVALPAQTPGEQKIAEALASRQQFPKWALAASVLGNAYLERARETGDPALLKQASDALDDSLKLEPDNIPALKVRAAILLERRADAEAKALLVALKKRGPDDLEVASLLARAGIALGDYALAEKEAQFIRDLRPAERLGYLRGAELREVYGDNSGALDYWRQGLNRTLLGETEQKAYILVRIARLQSASGNEAGAAQSLRQALGSLPGYYLALAQLARLQVARNEPKQALETLHQGQSPAQEYLYAWALALQKSGEQDEARLAWRRFVAQSDGWGPLLARYYLEVKPLPVDALGVLQDQAKRRQDVETLHLLAWALLLNKRPAEAAETIDKALRTGVRDAEIFSHAGQIAAARGDQATAQRYFQQCTQVNPHFACSPAR